MLGHGQIEGYAEKYGMEYYRAYWDEKPDQYLISRHEREVFPVIKKRHVFAGTEHFLLYDFYTDYGVNENVYAHSNRAGDERGLVLFNNAYAGTRGWIKTSAAYSVKTGVGDERTLIQRTIADSLGLPDDHRYYCIFKDYKTGMEYIRNAQDLVRNGFYADLQGYQYMVLMDWRIVEESGARPYGQVMAYLGGRGVPSVDDAVRELMVEPIRAPFRALINAEFITDVMKLRDIKTLQADKEADVFGELFTRMKALLVAIQEFVGDEFTGNITSVVADDTETDVPADADEKTALTDDDLDNIALDVIDNMVRLLQTPIPETPALANLWEAKGEDMALWAGWIATLILGGIGTPDQARSWMDEWFLTRIIIGTLVDLGMDEGNAVKNAFAVKLAVADHDTLFHEPLATPTELLAYAMNDRDGQTVLGVNMFQEVVWFSGDGMDIFLLWLMGIGTIFADSDGRAGREEAVASLYSATRKSDYQVERLKTLLKKPGKK
jgi:hypothetical protein